MTKTDFSFLGILPKTMKGLIGIITAPFIHSGLKHLFANTVPLLVLGSSLIYFYRTLAVRVFIWIWILSGIWVWAGGRESYHIGASGLIYGLASFLFFSGVIRKEIKLLAIALLVIFLYGSLVWGAIPDFLPEKNISWESHLGGAVSGVLLAFYFRKEGPQKPVYGWEDDEEEEEEDKAATENPYRYSSNTDDFTSER